MDWVYSLFDSSGYPVLFALAFLAATILPIGSEWLLAAMVLNGYSPLGCVVVAGVGNYLGACTTMLIGWWGSTVIIRKWLRMDERTLARAERLYERFGSWSLLLSWVPLAGDPLCLTAGLFRVHFLPFSVLVCCGKFARYAVLAWAVA